MSKYLLFTLSLLFTSSVCAEEFERKYKKEVDLKKIEKKVNSNDVEEGLLDETSTEKTSDTKTNFDFDSMLIDGTTKAPTGFLITGKKSQTFQRMIQLRKNFKKELKKSTEQLPALVK